MTPLLHRVYKRSKPRKLLVISAGGETSGIQGLYCIPREDGWEIVSHAIIPYASKTGALIESCRRQAVAIADLGWLESKITSLAVECAKMVLGRAPRTLQKPHIIVFHQLLLWKGIIGDNEPLPVWNMTMGDPRVLAKSLGAPVISDFSRYSLIGGGNGSTPTLHGNLVIARHFASGIAAFLNIGLIARLTIIDRASARCILDSDTGPGTCLVNRCAREANAPEGFDRDGFGAASGAVNAECLETLATSPWFLKAAPKEASSEQFDYFMQKSCLMALSPADKIATVTALTARTIYDFFRTHYKDAPAPEAIVLSGGGANNLSLVAFLRTYFGQVPIKNCEELGIPVEMRVPLALGLSIDALFSGSVEGWENGKTPAKENVGRLTMP